MTRHFFPTSNLRAVAASFATDSIASLACDDDQSFEEPAVLHRFLPLAALRYVSVSLPAHARAQQEAAGAVRGRIMDSVTGRAVPTATVNLMRNQRVYDRWLDSHLLGVLPSRTAQ